MTAATVSKEKLLHASENFLIRKNYEVFDAEPEFDIVAFDRDENTLCLINVEQAFDSWPSKKILTRDAFEQKLLSMFANGSENISELGADYSIRYDEIHVMVLNHERAILRHHINALEAKED